MSMINRLFGKAQTAPPPSESIKRLRETLEMLEKREKYLEKKVDTELDTAKKNVGKNKRAALMALRRKKIYEGQMEKLGGARMTIETQIIAIENATTNFAALEAMREGARAMKNISHKMNIDDVEDVMEDIREQMDLANEVSDAIAQPLGVDYDEDELNKELEDLEQESLHEKLSEIDDSKQLPELGSLPPVAAAKAAGSARPARPIDDEEAQLNALAMEMQ